MDTGMDRFVNIFYYIKSKYVVKLSVIADNLDTRSNFILRYQKKRFCNKTDSTFQVMIFINFW